MQPLEIRNKFRGKVTLANNWNIPDWLEKEVRDRDKVCVYCRSEFTPVNVSRKTAASWEHIINDVSIITRENIALCCCGCNSSKGQKPLLEWLNSKYCSDRNISKDSVAPIIKTATATARCSE
ncbi:hypothetical protein MCY_01314 [Bartonella rattimassiliensis 15908]|uniref:HNH endonuclease n=1 Tax=Bartonella rattimassiliensis 15908 TaxID=1094556 RepID=J0Z6N7_9HYPH|nr:hypothetical protein MCY_01314 [Bartonella rattimassiliensis 15908]